MSRRERLLAAVRRQPVDRVPYAVWRRFPTVDRSPAGLAQATLRFHDRYGSDFLTLTPAAGFVVEAWGCVEADAAGPDGARPCARCAVRHAEDWKQVRPLDPHSAPGYADQLETIVRLGFDRRIGDAPVLIAVPSPLSVARRLAGDRLAVDLPERADLVRDALDGITETLLRFADLALSEGISGLFYVMDTASRRALPDEACAELGEPYDRRLLDAVQERSLLTIVHAPGDQIRFAQFARLPADAWSWEDRATPPSLAGGQALVRGAVVGGLDGWKTLRDGTPEQAVAEVQNAIAQTGGLGLVVAPGGPLPPNTPDPTIAAVVRALGGPLKPILGVTR